jgi:pilus assembly protein CpaB
MGRRIVAIFAAAVVALLGAAAVMVYANGADARAVASQQPTPVYVVKTLVPAGTTLKDAVQNGLIVKTSVAAKGLPLGALVDVNSGNGGLYSLSDLQPGQYVLAAGFGSKPVGTKAIDVPAGQVAVSINLPDPARVGTFVTPGSRLVLFDSFQSGGGANGSASGGIQTRVLLDNVQVIAMGATSLTPSQATKPGDSTGSAPAATALLTVAVTPTDAVRLVHGIQTGSLYAALRGTDAKIDLGKVVTQTTLFAGQ